MSCLSDTACLLQRGLRSSNHVIDLDLGAMWKNAIIEVSLPLVQSVIIVPARVKIEETGGLSDQELLWKSCPFCVWSFVLVVAQLCFDWLSRKSRKQS